MSFARLYLKVIETYDCMVLREFFLLRVGLVVQRIYNICSTFVSLTEVSEC
jgi:hypothetical protein